MGEVRVIFRSLYLCPGKSHGRETWIISFGCPYSTIWYQEPWDPHENPGTTWHPQSVLPGTYGLEWTSARNRHVVGKVEFRRGRWWFRGLRFPFSCWVMAVFVETAINFFCALTPPRLIRFGWKLVSRCHLACRPQTPKTLPKPQPLTPVSWVRPHASLPNPKNRNFVLMAGQACRSGVLWCWILLLGGHLLGEKTGVEYVPFASFGGPTPKICGINIPTAHSSRLHRWDFGPAFPLQEAKMSLPCPNPLKYVLFMGFSYPGAPTHALVTLELLPTSSRPSCRRDVSRFGLQFLAKRGGVAPPTNVGVFASPRHAMSQRTPKGTYSMRPFSIPKRPQKPRLCS